MILRKVAINSLSITALHLWLALDDDLDISRVDELVSSEQVVRACGSTSTIGLWMILRLGRCVARPRFAYCAISDQG